MTAVDNLSLQGYKVWVTRPEGQANKLIKLIEAAGGEAIHFPVIEIHTVENAGQRTNELQGLAGCYAVIFVSRSAVKHAFSLVPDLSKVINTSVVIAVGAGTGAELASCGVANVVTCPSGSGSEAVLQLADLQPENIRSKRLVIIRGEGGRELLKDSLSEHSCKVDYIEVYKRVLPAISVAQSKKVWQENKPDVIVVTSVEGLHNLIKLIPEVDHSALFNTPLVVVSERMQKEAKTMGFTVTPYIEDSVSDEGLLRATAHSFENK